MSESNVRGWMLLLGLVAVLWANLPYLVGFFTGSERLTFGGFFVFPQDGFSYLAKMRQGAEGAWLFRLPYSTEPQQGQPIYLFYLAAGRLAQFLGLPFLSAYHLTRLLGSGLLLASCVRLVSHFGLSIQGRLITWTLVLFGGGVGFLISLFRPEYVAFAVVAPDAFFYSILYGPPHIIFALAILLGLMPSIFQALESQSPSPVWRAWGTIAAGVLLMSLTRPEYMGVLLSILAAYLLALGIKCRRSMIRPTILLGCMVLPGTLYALYVFILSRTDPVIAGWTAQNPFATPPIHNLAAGMGPIFLLGAVGLATGSWWSDEQRLLLFVWVVILPVMLYLPLSLSRRLVGGAQIALALPAGFWVDAHLLPWLKELPWRRVIRTPALTMGALILFNYPALFGLGAVRYVASRPDDLFLSDDELAAHEWLAMQEDGHVVLSSERTGIHIPAFSDATPVLGHPIETLAVEQKRTDVSHFFSAGTSLLERRAILANYGVDLVWWGPAERACGENGPSGLPDFREVFRHGNVQIWGAER